MAYPLIQTNHNYYVVVNAHSLLDCMRQKISHPFHDDQWQHLRVPAQALTAFPQLPFVFTRPPLASCRLLGPLTSRYVKKYAQDSYGLEHKTSVHWTRLETTLVNII